MAPAVRYRAFSAKGVSRTRCSVLHAAPLIRDPHPHLAHGPRISSAPRRKNGALRCVRGTYRSPAPYRRHHHLVAPAGAAIDFIAVPEFQVLAHADPHLAEPGPVA